MQKLVLEENHLMTKTIIHFIFNLGRGGAETMLVQVLKELKEYNNIVVTLQSDNSFENELICDKYICLNKRRFRSIPGAALELRKIIKKYKPDLVHSHLPLCNFVARLATPSGIPLVTTIHTSIATVVDYKKWHFRMLEKLTYKLKKSTTIFVSESAMKDYFSVLNVRPSKNYVLYTFADVSKYHRKPSMSSRDEFRIVSVGSLRSPKNYKFLINAFGGLKNDNVELTIYGKGPLEEELQTSINKSNVKIFLKGQVKNISEVLGQFDLFVMASIYEGFSLSVLEAMATPLPLLLSDIHSFREQCENCAIYFDLNNANDFIQKLKYCKENNEALREKAKQGHRRVTNQFTLEHHMTGLRKIYLKTLNNKI